MLWLVADLVKTETIDLVIPTGPLVRQEGSSNRLLPNFLPACIDGNKSTRLIPVNTRALRQSRFVLLLSDAIPAWGQS